jgi:hypothetical protein
VRVKRREMQLQAVSRRSASLLRSSHAVEVSACGLIDQVGLPCLVLAEALRERAEPVSDVLGVDRDDGVGFDVFSHCRSRDREIEQLLLKILNTWEVAGLGERDLVEQADRASRAGELCAQRSVKRVDGQRDPV